MYFNIFEKPLIFPLPRAFFADTALYVDSSLEIYQSRTDKNGPTYAIINGLTGRGKR